MTNADDHDLTPATPAAASDYAFDRAIAVTATDSPDRWRAHLPPDWRIHGGPINGGLTAALAAHALQKRLGAQRPELDLVCLSAVYLAAADAGPALVRTDVVTSSRSMSTGQASVAQPRTDGTVTERVRIMATFGDLGATAPTLASVDPPALPPPSACLPLGQLPHFPAAEAEVLRHYDVRVDPAAPGLLPGQPPGVGQLRAWFRMRDGRAPCPLMLPQVVDAFPPVGHDLGRSGWVPTVQLSVHVRARPAPGWLRVGITSATLGGGFRQEDADVWDSSSRLVAQGRQLAKLIASPTHRHEARHRLD